MLFFATPEGRGVELTPVGQRWIHAPGHTHQPAAEAAAVHDCVALERLVYTLGVHIVLTRHVPAVTFYDARRTAVILACLCPVLYREALESLLVRL